MKKYYGRTFKIALAFLAAWALVLFLGDRAIAEDISSESKYEKSFGSYMDGMRLLDACESSDTQLRVSCAFYIAGVVDFTNNSLLVSYSEEKKVGLFSYKEVFKRKRYCIGTSYSTKQMRLIILKFLQENPKILNVNASGLVDLALRENFPCPAK